MSALPERAKTIFLNAAEIASEAERRAYVEAQCGDDKALLAEVEGLLAHQGPATGFLKHMPMQAGATFEMSGGSGAHLSEGPGSKIGRYKLLQQIGEGGFGVVFMAEQESPMRRTVALKIIKLGMDTRQVVARFEAERQALAMMDHPGVAKVLDGGATATGRPYFVMELVKGTPITEYCDKNKLSIRQRLELFAQVCQAVQHAHQKGLIHRDIKPSNVMVSTMDGRPMVKVIDFGIAKATAARLTEKTLFTEFRQLIGTPEYMSPEQAEGGLDIDTRSDVYSLGVLLYELLAGAPPFDSKELRSKAFAEMQRIIREVDPPSPSTRLSAARDTLPSVASQRAIEPRKLQSMLHGELDWIVMKAIEKDRARRYETANGLAMDIGRYLAGEAVVAAPPSAGYRVRKFVAKHRASLAAAALVGVALVGGIVATSVMLVRTVRAESKVKEQYTVVERERNKAIEAERDASAQRGKAEEQSQRAQQLFADALISNGDALVTAGEYREAAAKFDEAQRELTRVGHDLERVDLSLTRLYRLSPPTMWRANIGNDPAARWTIVESRDEMVATTGQGTFRAIDLLTGQTVRSFGACRGIRTLASAPGPGGPVLVAGSRNEVRVIACDTGTVLQHAEDDRAAQALAVSRDGRVAVSIDGGGGVVFWEVLTLKVLGHGKIQGQLRLPAISGDGSIAACVGTKDEIYLYNTRDGSLRLKIDIPEHQRGGYRLAEAPGTSTVDFTLDGKGLICGETDGKLVTVSLEGKIAVLCQPHDQKIICVQQTPDGRIIICAQDGSLRVLERAEDGTCRVVLTLMGRTAGRLAAQFMSGGLRLCAATPGVAAQDEGVVIAVGTEGEVYAWPLVAPRLRPTTFQEGTAISPDGLLVSGSTAVGGEGGTVEVRDRATGRTLRVLTPATWAYATALGSGRDLYTFVYQQGKCVVQRFDVMSGRADWAVDAHVQAVLPALAVSSDGRMVASGGADGTRVWDAASGKLLRSLLTPGSGVVALAFAPMMPEAASTRPAGLRGHLLIAPDAGVVVLDWDLSSDARPRRAPAGFVRSFALAPDGRMVATVGTGKIDLVDLEKFRSVRSLGPLPSINYNLAFLTMGTRPGRWAISTGRTDFRVWNVEQQREELVLMRVNPALNTRYGGQQGHNTMVGTPDGTAMFANAVGRIDFDVPRLHRAAQQEDGIAARATLYARFGLWGWTRRLLEREVQAGRIVPRALRAQANWMCGDYAAAKAGFAEAARVGEIPQYYSELCASVEDEPGKLVCGPVAARPADPDAPAFAEDGISKDTVGASDVDQLRTMIGQHVIVEGRVVHAAWSGTGKSMLITFEDGRGGDASIPVVIFGSARAEFDKAFGGDVAGAFAGAHLRISGKVGTYGGYLAKYKGWPQIILDTPSQVKVNPGKAVEAQP